MAACSAGFDGLDSEYIVPGSCGLIYSLNCDRIDAAQAEETALRNKVDGTNLPSTTDSHCVLAGPDAETRTATAGIQESRRDPRQRGRRQV